MNRLTNSTDGSYLKYGYSYTATGQRQSMTLISYYATIEYQYDPRDRLSQKQWEQEGSAELPNAGVAYGYDANGNITNISSEYGNGVQLSYAYDPLNRLTNVLSHGLPAASYQYDLAGNVKGMGYGNGVTNLYQYDSQNRLTNLVWQAGGAGLASFGYKLMPGGTRTNALETVNAGPAVTCQWSFDGLYRLTNEIVSGIGNAAYQYDGVGNRLGRVGSLGPVNQSASYDTNDVWTAGSYGNPTPDKDFNTTSYNGNSYGYDSLNRVTSLNGVGQNYYYDGDGNLLLKNLNGTITFYLVDDRNPSGYAQVLEEYTETNGWGSAGWDLSRVYVYGLGLISEQGMDLNTLMPSTLSYYGYDGHGNVRFLMDTNGAVTDKYTYDAFGNLIGSSGTTPNSYLYCGQRWDADLGLYYNRARYMNPDAGRFMTMDTYEGDQEDPLSLHKYLYGEDNPVNLVDPLGRASWAQNLGYDAERAIDEEYRETHLGQAGILFGNAVGYNIGGITGFLKPDIYNPNEKTFLEIKPISSSGVAKGVAKLLIDYGAFPGFSPDTKWQSRTALLRTPTTGTTIFVRNVGGIVFYQNIDRLQMELITAAVITTPQQLLEYLRFPIWELAPALREASLVPEIETADIEGTIGIATLDSSLGAP